MEEVQKSRERENNIKLQLYSIQPFLGCQKLESCDLESKKMSHTCIEFVFFLLCVLIFNVLFVLLM